MGYNKKQMQPLIDKYAINPETNKLFINVIDMFDEQPNYQIWAVKMIFSKIIDFEQLTEIHDWAEKNQTMVKFLDKHNIVSYSSKTAIEQLVKEMKGVDMLNFVKNIISHFNTDQRKMLTNSILTKEFTPLEAYRNSKIKEWYNIFVKFNKLPMNRKNKFYSNCSRFKASEDLFQAIKSCLEETYEWNKEDFIAFMENNASDCQIVFDKGPYLIIRVPSFKSSKLLCGNGRTKWCITQQDSYFRQYVSDHSNRDQYFMFDFSRKEADAFAHIGFTVESGSRIYCAQTCNNYDMVSGHTQGNETLTFKQALEKAGANMSIFLRLKPLTLFKWDEKSIVELVKAQPNEYAIAYSKDGRYVINCITNNAFRNITSHTLINNNVGYSTLNSKDKKEYVFLDFNLKYDDANAFLAMVYNKDNYGTLSLSNIYDSYNNEVRSKNYLSSIGISREDYLNCEAIEPKILLHKFIDEGDEISALKLIQKEGKKLDVNYEFGNKLPVISAVNQKMFGVFEQIVNHPSFDSSVEDGFGETLLESLIYLYGSDEISSSEDDIKALKKMIDIVISSNVYDFNIKDINSDVPLNCACESKKTLWVVEALVSNESVDVNVVNDFNCSALTNCINSNNIEALKILCQRPDLKIREEDRKLAKNAKIELDDYIKPNPSIFKDVVTSKTSELELVMSEI